MVLLAGCPLTLIDIALVGLLLPPDWTSAAKPRHHRVGFARASAGRHGDQLSAGGVRLHGGSLQRNRRFDGDRSSARQSSSRIQADCGVGFHVDIAGIERLKSRKSDGELIPGSRFGRLYPQSHL